MCWLRHRWSKWSGPFAVSIALVRAGKAHEGMVHKQRRTCARCNAVQEREL